jgi:hypothetical protein
MISVSCSEESETDSTAFLANTIWINYMTDGKLEFSKDGHSVVMTEPNLNGINYSVFFNDDNIELFEPGSEERTYYGFIDLPIMILNTLEGEMLIYELKK